MESSAHKRRVTAAFAAADGYHARAMVQRQVADHLAARLRTLPLSPTPRILELGCGSGFLSRHLCDDWPQGQLLLTDIAQAMVARNRSGLAGQANRCRFLVMDGERPAVAAGWDLITASMAVQWFDDLPAALSRLAGLLNPGGWLACATLGRETFHEWRQVCDRAGLACGTPLYPTADQLQAMWPESGDGTVVEAHLRADYPEPLAFLRNLKALGAQRAVEGHRPVTAGQMRRLLRTGSGDPAFFVTYHILYGFFQRRS